jgi:hypothetical protein
MKMHDGKLSGLTVIIGILLMLLTSCAADKVVRLYDGDPLSPDQVSKLTAGTSSTRPNIGGIPVVKIDDKINCYLSPGSTCEFLPGNHTIHVKHYWYSSKELATSALAAGMFLYVVTVGRSLGLTIPPDMKCESMMELNSQGGHTYTLNVDGIIQATDTFNVLLEDMQSGELVGTAPCLRTTQVEQQPAKNRIPF